MLQILSLFFGITARRKTCLWKFKELVKRSWYKNTHPAWCTTDPVLLLLVPVQFWVTPKRSVELFVHISSKNPSSGKYFNTASVAVNCYLSTNSRNQDLEQGKGKQHLATRLFGPNSTRTAPTEIQIWATFVSRLSTECVSIVIEMEKGMSFWTLFHWSELPAQPMSSDQK